MRAKNSWPRVLAALTHPMTHHQVAMLTFMNYRNAGRILLAMQREGLVHVVRWDRHTAGCPTPVYAIGSGPSVPKPKPKTEAQKSKEYRARSFIMRRKPRRDIASSWI